MTSPPRKNRPRALTWLWKVTDHQVISGLVVAAILALSGLVFATSGHDGGPGSPAISGAAPVTTVPENLLFVLARYANHAAGAADIIWAPRA
jgi:hypothetical protein